VKAKIQDKEGIDAPLKAQARKAAFAGLIIISS
jgi:hypothetical protein